ncbi:discoidin domain-containing protein [Sphingomonas sp. PAMC 26621]|uniref:discoidin domain-containing protein n=1 Tax=Sphingomonas sp. PAMC 26621 TaxID=1112213 RepID=UPI000561D7CE|nr:discoidin domain-containing protein [Sphingomonas sp. PAMC 26621]
MLAALLLAGAAPTLLLDGFETAQPWHADASNGVEAKIDLVPGATGKALRLRYDFRQVAGYAFARRALPIDWPANFRVRLKIRGTGGVNDLQIKVSDASGANVWWVQRRNFRASAEWQTIELRPRDFSFAWGPSADKTLRRTAAMEVVVVRGRDGGAGEVAIDDLEFEALPVPGPLPAPLASDPRVIDHDPATGWTGRGGDSVQVDFGGITSLGGAVLHWAPGRGAPRYAVQGSDDGKRWRTLRTVTDGDGGADPIALPQADLRYLRVQLPSGAPAAMLAEIETRPPEVGETPNAFITALAKDAPRGTYPRGFTGEQPYWTLVASDTGATSALIGEDGAIEVAKGGFSVEPFVVADGRTFSWADVIASQSLEDDGLPLPHVAWQGPGWRLDTSVFADTGSPRLMARWRLTNTGTTRRRLRLLLAVRPLQVNAPTQFLGQAGGVSPIGQIAWDGHTLGVTNVPAIAGDPPVTRHLTPLVEPDAVATAPFDRGALAVTDMPARHRVDDPVGLASATLRYDSMLAPGASVDVPMVIASDAPPAPVTRAAFDRAHDATRARWQSLLGGVTISVPPAQRAVADTVRTALAQVLMSRTGPALQPGTRSYDRSWIRDGAMMSDTLLRLGLPGPARTFADWYGTKLFANGKVPCCVDPRGADPVPENDSNGEYIHLVTQLYRFTGDRGALLRDWPRIDAARRYMDTVRAAERGPAATPLTRGLMPASISHEAYSAAPQYSLWDDFWALTGYRDAAFAATVLRRPEARAIDAARASFATDIHAAIGAATTTFRIDFIPGATSLGDFDATSTTIALDPAGEQDTLDPALLRRTFEKQWTCVLARTAPGADWADYTPYELRNVSAFVRLGWAERANHLLEFYMAGRRPAAWNGWAEVVGRLPREQRFIGDMPHAWVASDFIRAALDLFAYERSSDHALILGGGLTERWQVGRGSAIRGLHTAYGTLDVSVRRQSGALVIEIGGTARPPGGFVIPWVSGGRPGQARVNGKSRRFASDGLHVRANGKRVLVVVTMPH